MRFFQALNLRNLSDFLIDSYMSSGLSMDTRVVSVFPVRGETIVMKPGNTAFVETDIMIFNRI